MTTEKTPNAASLLLTVGELPESSRDFGAAPDSAPAVALHDPHVDPDGVRFDAARHESDRNGNPQRRADGRWKKKRGNGGRKANGHPLLNLFASKTDDKKRAVPDAVPDAVPHVQTAEIETNTEQPNNSGSSFMADAPSAGAAGQTVQGVVVDAAPQKTLQDYDSTATSLTHGQFAVLQMLLGPAWQSDKEEHRHHVDAWRRVLHHYQFPVIGPLLELGIVLCTSIAKRSGDVETNSRVSGIWRWLTGQKSRPAIADEQGE